MPTFATVTVRLLPCRFAGPRLHVAWLGVRLVFDRPLAAGTSAKRLWPLLGTLGLAFERLGEHFFRENVAYRDDDVFQLGERGAPRQPLRAIKAIDQTFGHAFDVRLHRLNGRGYFFLACHPWLLFLSCARSCW